MEMDIGPVSCDEMNTFAKPLKSITNNVHQISKSSIFPILENDTNTTIGDCSNSVKICKHLEAIQEKYYNTKLDRDQLVKRNLILSKDLQNAEALITKKIQENEQLVQQSQTESAHWKEQATAVQTENAKLVKNLENMGVQLEFLDPENFARVKEQQNGIVEELAYCEVSIKKETEQRRKLENARKELEEKLEREKASTITHLREQEMMFRNISKKLELEKISIEQQIKDATLELQNCERRNDIVEKVGKQPKMMLELNEVEDEWLPASFNVEPLRSNDKSSLVFSNIIEQVGMQRIYLGKLHELCNSVVIERDRTMEEVELLKVRLGEDFMNEEALPSTIESDSEDLSELQRLKQEQLIRKASSHKSLAAKIRVLQLESRHKSKMIQFLQQDKFDEFDSEVRNEHS